MREDECFHYFVAMLYMLIHHQVFCQAHESPMYLK
jgi:hypothetical protein